MFIERKGIYDMVVLDTDKTIGDHAKPYIIKLVFINRSDLLRLIRNNNQQAESYLVK